MNWLKLLAIIMVLAAFANLSFLPYAYYQLMNWVVAGAAVAVAMHSYQRDYYFLMWIFALVAVIFNPLAPIYLRADVWKVTDIVAALLFVISLFVVRPVAKKQAA
jgi:FtsH-binding integral membrane protein